MPKEKSEWLKKFIAGIADNTIDLWAPLGYIRFWTPSVFSELKDNEVKSVVKVLKKKLSLKETKETKLLKTLNFSDAKLKPENIVNLLETFSNYPLEKLDVSHQNLLLGAVKVITWQLKNRTLQELRMRSCKLDDQKLLSVLETLSQNQSLKALHITHQNLSSEMIKFIADMLRINTKLKKLALRHCQLDGNKISPIINALSNNKSLRELALFGNNFSYAAAKSLNSVLSKYEPPIICRGISEAIKDFEKTLAALATECFVELSLNNLQLTAQDMETISSQVNSNKELSKVNIKKTSLINVAVIVRALPVSTEITIDLSNQEVDIEIICELLENNNIVSLDLSNTKLGPKDAKRIAESLKENKSLESLHLSNNQLGDEGIGYLSQALSKNNSTLMSLDLNYNNFTTVGLERIVAMLAFNYNLYVDYKFNSIKNDPKFDPTFQITIIGNSGAGKTCLVDGFINGYPSPILHEYDITVPGTTYRKIVSEPYCVLDFVDTLGMEDYIESQITEHYPGTDLFLICFALVSLNSFNDASRFIFRIKNHFPGTPFLLIGTKSDCLNEIVVNDKDAQKLAQEYGAEGYIKCSGFDIVSINYVFQRAIELCFKTKKELSYNRSLWSMHLLIKRNVNLNEKLTELERLKDANKKLETLLNATKSSQTLISPSSKQLTELATSLKANATQSYDQLPKIVQQSPLRYRYNQEGKLILVLSASATKSPLRWQRNDEGKLITTSVSFWQSQAIESIQGTPALATKQTAMIVEKENVSVSQSKH